MSKRRSYGPSNYKGKNPMSRTHWRRFHRNQTAKKEAAESSNNKPYQSQVKDQVRKPVGRQLFSPKTSQSKGKVKEEVPSTEDELVTDNFDSGSKDDFDMLSVLPRE